MLMQGTELWKTHIKSVLFNFDMPCVFYNTIVVTKSMCLFYTLSNSNQPTLSMRSMSWIVG